jgi:hypothetical protein
MVTLAEQAIGSALQIEARRNRMEKQLGTLEMRLGVSDVVGVFEEECSDAKASLDLHDREEGHVALANGFEALHRFFYLTFPLVVIGESPESLRQCFHVSPI